jgi:genome maintenance exonuclease 1
MPYGRTQPPIVGNFKHVLAPRIELEDEIVPGTGRIYTTPAGDRYESVTTILGKVGDKSWKDRWIAKVGEAEAAAITARAITRGNFLHGLCERYLKNETIDRSVVHPGYLGYFLRIKPVLDCNIEKIFGIEYPLFSKKLCTAGRADLIGRYDGERAVIDFKGSNRVKNAADIPHYFIQSATYATMFEDRFRINIPRLVIIMVVENVLQPLVFVQETEKWRPCVKKIFEERNFSTVF